MSETDPTPGQHHDAVLTDPVEAPAAAGAALDTAVDADIDAKRGEALRAGLAEYELEAEDLALLGGGLAGGVKEVELVVGAGGDGLLAGAALAEVVGAKRLEAFERDAGLFLDLSAGGLLGRLVGVGGAAGEAPVSGEHDLRVVVAQLHEHAPLPVDEDHACAHAPGYGSW